MLLRLETFLTLVFSPRLNFLSGFLLCLCETIHPSMRTAAWIWFWRSRSLQVLALAGLCLAAYACCVNNGFISDDFVNLRHADALKSDFWTLFQSPPLNFRLTSFLVYSVLQTAFGGRYELFYAANILLHFINCLLLWKLLVVLERDVKEAYLAAALFAVFQAPQEAVMWISAMNETLLGLFVLSALVLWFKGRRFMAAIFFLLALFSKESAPILFLLIPLIRWTRGEKILTTEMAPLAGPAALFAAAFAWTWSGNSMIQHGIYKLGPGALLVLGRSLHLLFRPAFYVVLAILLAATRSLEAFKPLTKYLVWIAVPMSPYVFLTYSPYIPSRQVYLASMVLASVMAYLILQWMRPALQFTVIMAFIAYNVGYMWLRNDPQFEGRAAPTTQLLTFLRSRQPRPILIERFPYEASDIAKDASRFAPGWSRDDIHVNEPPDACPDCVILRWDEESKTYDGL